MDQESRPMSYLVHYQFIPYERANEASNVLFGISINLGTVVNITHTLSEKLILFHESV